MEEAKRDNILLKSQRLLYQEERELKTKPLNKHEEEVKSSSNFDRDLRILNEKIEEL